MNERIQKLVEQAEEWVCKNYPDAMDDNEDFHAQTMYKLAELIVLECREVLIDMMDEGRGDSLTLDIALIEIDDKFGVEE